MLAAAMAAGLALPAAAMAQAGEIVDGVLQPLADGFPNRAITIINPDDPGSRDGIYARSIQEAARKISPVEIILSDEPAPAFATFYTINDVKTRDGGMEGYYPIIVSVVGTTADLTVEPITKETGLTAEDMDMVITTDTIPYIVIGRKDAVWGKSFADLVKYGKEHPGELKYISNQVGSGNDLAMEWVLDQVGVEVNKIPAPSNDAVAAAIGAGEGDFSMSQAGVALQHYQAGKVEVLLVTGDTVPAPWDKDPASSPARPPGCPESPGAWSRVLPCRRACRRSTSTGSTSSSRRRRRPSTTNSGRRPCRATSRALTPAEANALKMQVLEFTDPVVREMGLHIDQK